MAKLEIDISGRRGLLQRHQGDLNDSTSKPNLRYTGQLGQFAEGIFNPVKRYGYLNPANSNFADLTGTIGANIIAIEYDGKDDIVYLAEEGVNILKLDGMNDTSLSNYLSITSGQTIKDMILYEMNSRPVVLYVIDSGQPAYSIDPATLSGNNPDDYYGGVGGMYVGFKMIGTSEKDVIVESNEGEVANLNAVLSSTFIPNTIDDGTAYSTKLCQPFSTDTIISKKVEKIALRIARVAGSTAGVTLKLSIQASALKTASPYTNRGAWANSISYVAFDVVTYLNIDYVCYTAHTSVTATNRPSTGSDEQSFWQRFGSPSGTDIASVNVDISALPDAADGTNLPGFTYTELPNVMTIDRTVFTFASIVTLDANTIYWLVLEEVGSVMTSADRVSWFTTVNNNAQYDTLKEGASAKYLGEIVLNGNPIGLWANCNLNYAANEESRDFIFQKTRADDWSMNISNGHFTVPTGKESFLFLAENALVYWFAGNKVHTIDGGATGGRVGRANQEVLSFPDYLTVVDVAETRSSMYLGINDVTTTSDGRYNPAREIGVFIWNKRSQVFGGTEFYRAVGAKQIKKVFLSSNGDVKIITIGNSGQCEIRALSGQQFAVIHTFEQDGFPVGRNSVSQLNGLTTWTGKNGIKYAYGNVEVGEAEQLYKIGDESGEYGANPIQGAMFVGNENTAQLQSAMLTAWKDDAGNKVQKWYPHGEGIINTVAQKALVGNAYSKVYEFPIPISVQWGHLYFLPIAGGDTTAVATVKVYYNKSATAGATFNLTSKDLAKGYFYMLLGEKNVFAIQVEVEWNNTQTLGSFDFQPKNLIVEYNDTVIKKK